MMMGETNAKILQSLISSQRIRVKQGKLFQTPVLPKPSNFDFARIEGMLLGIAIGDSLGMTTESMLPAKRHALYGELRDYIPTLHVIEAIGSPSDDTQLSFWTLEQLIMDGRYVPAHVAFQIAHGGRIFGLGNTISGFLDNYLSGMPWDESGLDSAGNGALMRIAPLLVPHLQTGGTDLWADVALAGMTTHNSFASNSACLAFVAMLWELLDMEEAPAKEWWVNRYVELARDLEGEAVCKSRTSQFGNYAGPLWRFVEERLHWADSQGLPVLDACNAWYSGAYLLETLPSVLYILMRHAHEPEEAMVRAVNDTKDNDTIAAIVGAALGALHGRDAFPDRWISKLSGRTSLNDNGRVFELIREARSTFWES